MKNLLLASTSALYSGEYLDYLFPELDALFKNCSTILFIPYARPGGISHEQYTEKVRFAFAKINKKVVGLHEFENPQEAIKNAQGIFTGGGNTFLLVSQLYKFDVMTLLNQTLLDGTPYLGASAGSNIAGVSMQTTNDMPIIYPPSFETLGLLPFNLNVHFIEPDSNSHHMGESRETRIKEFQTYNEVPVLGLREGSWLEVKNDTIILKGDLCAKWFAKDAAVIDIAPETNFNFKI